MAWKWMDDDNDDQMLRVWLNSMSQISRYHLVLINHHSSPLYLLFHYLCFDSLRYGMEGIEPLISELVKGVNDSQVIFF